MTGKTEETVYVIYKTDIDVSELPERGSLKLCLDEETANDYIDDARQKGISVSITQFRVFLRPMVVN